MNPDQAEAIPLENGRLTARPGPDIYLYSFKCQKISPCDIGQRGRFIAGQDTVKARVTDRRGPFLSLCLTAEKPLPATLSGHFRPSPALPAAETSPDENQKYPKGIRQFLDSREGWVMELTEAASRKTAHGETDAWPSVPLAGLPGRTAGLSFVWRQSPKASLGVEALLAEHFSRSGRVLVLGETPALLEALAGLPEALFLGPAEASSPLYPISVYTKIAGAIEEREAEQAGLRGQANDLVRAESALKAEISRWDDLAALERRFADMGNDAARLLKRGNLLRQNLEGAAKAWEEAGQAVKKSGRGLLGRLKKSGPDEKALRLENSRRESLDTAESRVAQARREEEEMLEKSLNLERQLSSTRLDSQNWPSRKDIDRRFRELREQERAIKGKEAALNARPIPARRDILAAAPLVLALIADMAPGEALHKARFTSLMALTSSPPDHEGRQRLAGLALSAEENFLIMGDFTFWPAWRAGQMDGQGAWPAMILKEEADPFKEYLARGGPFTGAAIPETAVSPARLEPGPDWADFLATDFKYIVEPAGSAAEAGESGPAIPASAPPKKRGKKVTSAVPAFGLGLRGFGEIGPANPISALMAARCAMEAERGLAGGDPAVIILVPSPAQGRLVEATLRDLGAPAGRIYCGEPQDFRYWPKVPLVIVDPAFEAPHQSHPWAWPAFGRQRLAMVWHLAAERIWVLGRDGWMARLSEGAPLSALWRLAKSPAPAAPPPPPAPSFWEALDKAKKEVWAIVPSFEAFWWRPLEEHFLAARRRRVSVTILCAPPEPGRDREYPSAVIRTLSAYGSSIHLASGLPGFMAVVDDAHLTWGHFVEGAKGAHIWGGLKSALLPLAAREIGKALQIETIKEKLGRKGGGLKNCPVCGWPMVLINDESMRGYGDEQPLKVGCLGGHGERFPRRLDERDPFPAPPRCGEDNKTPYTRKGKGKSALWVCPNHPDGGPRCPSYKALPGDAP